MLEQAKNKCCVFKRLMEWIYCRCFLWFLFHDAFGVSDHITLMAEWSFERWVGKNLKGYGCDIKDNSIPTLSVGNWGKARNRFHYVLSIVIIIIIIIIIYIIIIIISFIQGICTYIPETNYVPREYIVAAPAALYPRERPVTHFTGGWVDPRAGLDGRKISSPPGFDPGPSSP